MASELEEAQAYEVKLRPHIIDALDQLTAGKTSLALSIPNRRSTKSMPRPTSFREPARNGLVERTALTSRV
jgi:hypothetical protein